MPVSALPAMRAAIAYSAPLVGGDTWATYANSVFDSLSAYEFRNAASLAGATLYGSAPSIVTQPGGGLNLTSAGLVCNQDTFLTTTATQTDIVALVTTWGYTTFSGSAAAGCVGDGSQYYYINHRDTTIVRAQAASNQSLTTTDPCDLHFAVIGGAVYWDSAADGSITISDTFSNGMGIGGVNNAGAGNFLLEGTIACICIGTLKGGETAATVASELYTRMQTAAL